MRSAVLGVHEPGVADVFLYSSCSCGKGATQGGRDLNVVNVADLAVDCSRLTALQSPSFPMCKHKSFVDALAMLSSVWSCS